MSITFTKYLKLVLPADGYVFWVKADLLSPSGLFDSSRFNTSTFAGEPMVVTPATTLEIDGGSFHHANDIRQEEGSTLAYTQMLFTSPEEIVEFETVSPSFLWIAEVNGFFYSISGRDWRFHESGIHHYSAVAVVPEMQANLISSPDQINSLQVVSNSLPLWLALTAYVPPYGPDSLKPTLPLYPSFLSPLNLAPPYGIVHVIPESTRALQASPLFDGQMNRAQLMAERVRITLYGTRNWNALDFVDAVEQYSRDTDAFGFMSLPALRDEKRTQAELQTIALKKSVEWEISYYQSRANNIARQLILQAFETTYVGDFQLSTTLFYAYPVALTPQPAVPPAPPQFAQDFS